MKIPEMRNLKIKGLEVEDLKTNPTKELEVHGASGHSHRECAQIVWIGSRPVPGGMVRAF